MKALIGRNLSWLWETCLCLQANALYLVRVGSRQKAMLLHELGARSGLPRGLEWFPLDLLLCTVTPWEGESERYSIHCRLISCSILDGEHRNPG